MDPQENSEMEQTNAEEPGPSSMLIRAKPKVRIIENGNSEVPPATAVAPAGNASSAFQSSALMGGSTVTCSTVSAAASPSISTTINQTIASEPMPMPMPTLRFVLRHPAAAASRRVNFHVDVVDNEFMNRRKSKCCCIYRKQHPFGESSSETDDECEHCFGHPEVRALNRQKKMMAACGCGCCGGQTRAAATEEPKTCVVSEESATSGVSEDQALPEVQQQQQQQQQSLPAAPQTADDQDGVSQEMADLSGLPEVPAKQQPQQSGEDTLS
ncbi:uncharacterized protein LOC111065377 [Drosophila obscura]|uniref:uncharacterized protein LOC111065377 n=1 Tax=Drosophila obscura TaxID=7282 RepID=UPI001BB1F6D2|nr:uncharacterized protein LOC111065377 [Drosophila obscura]